MSVAKLYERFDAIHDHFGLTEVACGGAIDGQKANVALQELVPLLNEALTELAKHEGVNPFDLSLVPALHASLANPKSDIRTPS